MMLVIGRDETIAPADGRRLRACAAPALQRPRKGRNLPPARMLPIRPGSETGDGENDRQTAKLTLDGKTYDLPVHAPTLGPDVVDIRKLYGEADVFTFDPGFTSTAACESAITYIDGDKGELLYRGYPIEQLAEKSTHLEVCYLLLYGELPTAAQLADFTQRVTRHTMVHEQMHYFFRGFRRDSHPMATMVGVVGAMSAFYHDSLDINDPWQREVAAIRMIAKLPTIAAMAYKYSIGQPFVYPRTASAMPATSCTCALPSRPRNMSSTRSWKRRWTAS
jgi:hypothetical protein